jgi:FixJ family two-component response regulator
VCSTRPRLVEALSSQARNPTTAVSRALRSQDRHCVSFCSLSRSRTFLSIEARWLDFASDVGGVILMPIHQHRILWIDDELDSNDGLVRLLSIDGFDVDVARSGNEGAARAKERDYALYLLDLHLPDVPGLDVLRRLRAEDAETPIILITGYATVAAAVEGMKAKVTNLLEKPVHYDDLAAALRTALPRSEVSGASFDAARRHLSAIVGTLGQAQFSIESKVAVNRARSCLIGAIASALSDPAVPLPTYAACARMLRAVVSGPAFVDAVMSCRLMAIQATEGVGAEVPPDIANPLEVLATADRLMSEHEVASLFGISARDLGIRLRTTGYGFREWRTLLRLRPLIGQLANTNEHVAQIAFAAGYEHPSQVDRDFMRCFGTTPRRLRELLKSASRVDLH